MNHEQKSPEEIFDNEVDAIYKKLEPNRLRRFCWNLLAGFREGPALPEARSDWRRVGDACTMLLSDSKGSNVNHLHVIQALGYLRVAERSFDFAGVWNSINRAEELLLLADKENPGRHLHRLEQWQPDLLSRLKAFHKIQDQPEVFDRIMEGFKDIKKNDNICRMEFYVQQWSRLNEWISLGLKVWRHIGFVAFLILIIVTIALSLQMSGIGEGWKPWFVIAFGFFGGVLSSMIGTMGHGKFQTINAFTYRQRLLMYRLRWLSGAAGALVIFCSMKFAHDVKLFNETIVSHNVLEGYLSGAGLALLATVAGFSERFVRGTLNSYTERFAGFLAERVTQPKKEERDGIESTDNKQEG